MSDDQSVEAMGHDLDRMLRTSVMMLGQLLERRARRRAEADRGTAGQARHGWIDERDSARKAYLPMTFGKRAEQAQARELARAWRSAHEWASTDPVAAAAAEHLQGEWQRLYPDRDPSLVGVDLTPDMARRVAQEHAPDFYRRHERGPDEDARLVADWTYWAEHGQLPRESLLREHAASWPNGPEVIEAAGNEAVQEWKTANFEPDEPGADGTSRITVPTARAGELDAIRRAAEVAEAERLWQEAGRAPLPVDAGAAAETRRPVRLDEARRLAAKHAPEFYHRHDHDRLYREEFRNEVNKTVLNDRDAAVLRQDWQHWREHGRLPRESLLREHVRHLGQEEVVGNAARAAEQEWVREHFPAAAGRSGGEAPQPVVVDDEKVAHRRGLWDQYETVNIAEYQGRTADAVIVPRRQAASLGQARRAAADAVREQIWTDAGRAPLPPDPGQQLSVQQARDLAGQHAPAYYRLDRIDDEQLVADWTHWVEHDQQLPPDSVRRQWAAHLGREAEAEQVADAAESQLAERVEQPSAEQVQLVRAGAEAEKLDELWAESSRIDVKQAETLAEEHAPPWYSAPDSATLTMDWQAYVDQGELPLERQQEAWATWAGQGREVSLEAWTDADGVLDEEGRTTLLHQVWDEGRDERAALSYAAAVAGTEAAAADRAEEAGWDSAAWSRVADSLHEQGPDATDLIGDTDHARQVYTPLLDPAAFSRAEAPEAARAWLAASVWASEDEQARAAADQLRQQYRVRFGHDPDTGEQVDRPDAPPQPEQHAAPEATVEPPRAARQDADAGHDGDTAARTTEAPAAEVDDPARTRIVELHEQAAAFYSEQYPGSKAEQHITERFGPDAAQRSGLTVGYAPAGFRGLTTHLRERGAGEQELIDSGLARRNSIGKLQDTFRDRVVFAVREQDGGIVGFTGRDLSGDPRAPKYWNTNKTAAFNKGDLLLGAAEAGPQARLVRVEGAMDVMAINLASPDQQQLAAVAPMGTALTDRQADLLAARSVNRTAMEALDPDEAGMRARGRDTRMLAERGVSLRTVSGFPGDPADGWQNAPEMVRIAAEGAARDGGRLPPSLHLAMHDTLSSRPDLHGRDSSWPAAQALGPMVAGAARQDQVAAARHAERLMIAWGADRAGDELSPSDARYLLRSALEREVARAQWAKGTSWETLSADLAGDRDALAWEADQERARADYDRDAAEDHLTGGNDQRQSAALSDDPETTSQAGAAAEQEERARQEHLAEAQQHDARADDRQKAAAAVRPAAAPEVYDRARDTPAPNVDAAAARARQRAGAGFSQSTASGVAAAQTKRARLPRKPAKGARMGQQRGRGRTNDYGR